MGFLTTLFRAPSYRAATPENPRFSLNDPAAWDAFGVQKSAAGITINRETALTYSPWWRGINLISNDVAKLDCFTYRRLGSDPEQGKKLAADHPAFHLLLYKPNERQTANVWKKQAMFHVMSEGNAYSYIERRGDATPVELLPLDPTSTYPVIEQVGDGAPRLWYVTDVNDDQRKLLPENVFHVKGLSFDGLVGYPVWQKALDALGLAVGAKRFATTTLKNSGRPATVLTHPRTLTDKTKEALLAGWARMHEGIDNAARTAILDGGLEAKPMGFNPEDMQMLGTMELSVRDIANFLGVAPHKLGDTSRTAYNSLEQENQSYLDEGLDPWLVSFEHEGRDKLLTEEEKARDSIIIKFNRRALMRADMTARANYFSKALAGQPWMSVNQVLEEEGYNPVPGGDEIKTPLNMKPAGQGDGQEEDKPAEPPAKPKPEKMKAVREACRAAMADVVGRLTRRVGVHAERAAANGGKAFLAWVAEFEDYHRVVARESCQPVEKLAAALNSDGRPLPGELADWLLAALRGDWSGVADVATEKDLQAAVSAAAAAMEPQFTAAAWDIFLRDDP